MCISREVLHIFSLLLEEADTPISLGVYLRVKYGMWDDIALMDVKPEWYDASDHRSYLVDQQACCFLKKYRDLDTSFDRSLEAKRATLEAERLCYRTNVRLAPFISNGPFEDLRDERIFPIIEKVRKEVLFLIGGSPEEPEFFFGPGATLSDIGEWVTIANKCASVPSLTPSALPFLPYFGRTAWGRSCALAGGELTMVSEARFTTVPKNAKTDRGIEIQPSINVSVQLGYGKQLRRRLARRGFDLDSLQDRHRSLARLGSTNGSLATLDLKSASDTVAYNLVKLLLPPKWFDVLNCSRVSHLAIDGHRYWLERFSSMGNGFTFELETLIFLSICRACSQFPESVSCYGDDIICHQEDVTLIRSALRWFGFVVNEEKSYSSGQFRESCGGDFFNGHDVRPFYLKETPSEPQHFISLANGLNRFRRRVSGDGPAFYRFGRAWRACLEYIPAAIRACRGPDYFGDLCIHDDEERWLVKVRHSIRYVRLYKPVRSRGVPWARFSGDVQLAAALYGAKLAEISLGRRVTEGFSFRNAVIGYKLDWAPYS